MPKIENGKQAPRPKLVNRGPAGLLSKKTGTVLPKKVAEKAQATRAVAINQIAPGLASLAVPIESVTPDPNNARLHPERNMESICKSLSLYGQVKPIVVRKATGVVIAGNGTLEAAKTLGWTEIAVSYVDMNEVEAAGYGLADNRTAELAKWDFEVVARLDRLLQEAGHESVGWSLDELEVLRAADWVPPPISDTPFGASGKDDPLLVSFTPDEYEVVARAIMEVRAAFNDDAMTQAACLSSICVSWLQSREEALA